MSASDVLNKELFHGTGLVLPIGGLLEPNAPEDEGGAAYATPDIGTARSYARSRAVLEGTLFGNVYRVKPRSTEPQVNEYEAFTEVADPKGMDILELVESPLNPKLVHKAD
jgi:hypothetical protein